jgi:hypothetical protein
LFDVVTSYLPALSSVSFETSTPSQEEMLSADSSTSNPSTPTLLQPISTTVSTTAAPNPSSSTAASTTSATSTSTTAATNAEAADMFSKMNSWAIDADEIAFLEKVGEGSAAKGMYSAHYRQTLHNQT